MNMKNFKLVALFVLFAISMTMLSACSMTAPTPAPTTAAATEATEASATTASTVQADEKLKFGFSIMIGDNPYFIAVKKGFEDRCKELGIEPVSVDAKYDSPTQISQVENFISSGVQAICIAPVDAKGLENVVDQAKSKGIIVVAEAQGIANADANVIVNDYEYGVANGKNVTKWINEKLGGKANVLIISQDNVEAVIQRGNGIEDTIKKESPEAVIVARQTGDTPEAAMKIAESVLTAHPEINVIACVNDSSALGAYEAVKAIVKDTTLFYVGGADKTDEAVAKMKEPDSFFRATVDIDPYGTGKKCVDVMLDYVKNGSKNETFYFDMIPVWQEDLK
jgi:ribose transport system substrate-binding protein